MISYLTWYYKINELLFLKKKKKKSNSKSKSLSAELTE